MAKNTFGPIPTSGGAPGPGGSCRSFLLGLMYALAVAAVCLQLAGLPATANANSVDTVADQLATTGATTEGGFDTLSHHQAPGSAHNTASAEESPYSHYFGGYDSFLSSWLQNWLAGGSTGPTARAAQPEDQDRIRASSGSAPIDIAKTSTAASVVAPPSPERSSRAASVDESERDGHHTGMPSARQKLLLLVCLQLFFSDFLPLPFCG